METSGGLDVSPWSTPSAPWGEQGGTPDVAAADTGGNLHHPPDVTKAHRRIKVLQKDWKYQVACIQNRWWVNRVGTYGMASAQLYWGRKASLVLRLCTTSSLRWTGT